MSDKFEISKSSGKHSWLKKIVGAWQGTTKTWFEPDIIADESHTEGTIRSILGERFIIHEYKSSLSGTPFEGIAIYGYQLATGKFQSAWIDSFHNGTAIMFSEGQKNADELAVLGSYPYITPEMEQYWGWRTEINIISENEIRSTAYNISPEGEEAKATETFYTKK